MAGITAIASNCVAESPGVVRILKFIPCDELTAEPKTLYELTPSTATTAVDKKTIGEIFAYKNNAAYFRNIEVAINTPMGKSDSVGEGGAMGFENGVDFSITNDSAATRQFADELVELSRCGCGVVVLLQNPDNGNFDKIGEFSRPATVKAINGSTGDKVGGSPREYKFSLSALSGKTPKIYPSTLAVRVAPTS